jgi:cyanate lyase
MSLLTRQQITELSLAAKDDKALTWAQLGELIDKSPVYTAMLVYGYGQASKTEAEKLVSALELPEGAKKLLMKVPHRQPAQPWPPTDPFIYRLYEAVMLYGPVYKDIAHEIFGDGIMSAIDMSVDIAQVEEPAGVPRMVLTLNGKWLQYKRF